MVEYHQMTKDMLFLVGVGNFVLLVRPSLNLDHKCTKAQRQPPSVILLSQKHPFLPLSSPAFTSRRPFRISHSGVSQSLRHVFILFHTRSRFPLSRRLVVIAKRPDTPFRSLILSSLCYLRSRRRRIYLFSTPHTPPCGSRHHAALLLPARICDLFSCIAFPLYLIAHSLSPPCLTLFGKISEPLPLTCDSLWDRFITSSSASPP
jgi:hypothetical protein